MIRYIWGSWGVLITAFLLIGVSCSGAEQAARSDAAATTNEATETPVMSEDDAAEPATERTEHVETGAEAETEASSMNEMSPADTLRADTPSANRAGGPGGPGAVAPPPGGDRPTNRHWMAIEFVRPIEDADLAWLEESGFHVDTVLSATLLRGWLEDPEGGAALGTDPRIAEIHAQMR